MGLSSEYTKAKINRGQFSTSLSSSLRQQRIDSLKIPSISPIFSLPGKTNTFSNNTLATREGNCKKRKDYGSKNRGGPKGGI
jgi:hypothetical protein